MAKRKLSWQYQRINREKDQQGQCMERKRKRQKNRQADQRHNKNHDTALETEHSDKSTDNKIHCSSDLMLQAQTVQTADSDGVFFFINIGEVKTPATLIVFRTSLSGQHFFVCEHRD